VGGAAGTGICGFTVRDGNYLSGEARLIGIGSTMKSLARASWRAAPPLP
jgi:hypothetical protein